MSTFDLDAILAETEDRTLIYKQIQFVLPGELPGACIAPFLDPSLGLAELVAEIIAASDDEKPGTDADAGWMDALIDAVKNKPTLPVEILNAAKVALSELLGEKAEEFYALKPSVNAYAAIAGRLIPEYGVGLADFFFSAESSPSGGTESKPTSSTTTDSTHEGSGDEPATPTTSV